jgi:general secretion pathway protein G
MKAIETRRMRGQGGFTLIELLVVIAILGVLAGVVVFAVNGIQSNADDSACKIDKRTLQTAVQAFRADRGVYPNDEAQLQTDGFIEEESDKWDIGVSPTGPPATAGGPATYTKADVTFTGLGNCA